MSGEVTALLKQLNELDECESIEAKRSADELGKRRWRRFPPSRTSRGSGRYPPLRGLGERGGRVRRVRSRDPAKLAADLASQCASAFNRPVRPRIIQETVEGRTVVAAVFQEAAPGDKPIFIASRGMQHGTYRRIAGTDQRATEDDFAPCSTPPSGSPSRTPSSRVQEWRTSTPR